MKVLVAGATGAIGSPLIAALTAARHEVVGMASSAAGLQALRERGADAVVVNALDAAGVEREVTRTAPDAIVDELTSLPKRYTSEQPLIDAGFATRIPVGRAGIGEEIAQATLLLVRNGYMTGQTIAVNGGVLFS